MDNQSEHSTALGIMEQMNAAMLAIPEKSLDEVSAALGFDQKAFRHFFEERILAEYTTTDKLFAATWLGITLGVMLAQRRKVQ